MVDTNMPGWTCLALPIAVEAAARSGRLDLAEGYLEQLRVRTEASGTNWALGQLCRCHALLAGSEAEPFHKEAIGLLATTSVVTELAQAHLGYGEWLRLEGRQVEARGELRSAYDLFVSMGADAFASGRVLSCWLPAIRYSVTVLTSGRALRRKKARQPGSLRTAQQTPRLPHRCSSARTRWTITCARSTESSGSARGESFRRRCVRSTNSAGGGQRVGRVAGIELSTCTAQESIAARVRSDSSPTLGDDLSALQLVGVGLDRGADPSGCPPGPLA